MRISDWSSDVCSSDLHGKADVVENSHACFPPLRPATLTCNRGGGKTPAAWRPRRFRPLTLSGFFASLPPFHLPPGSARGSHLPRFPLMPSAASLDQLQTLSENLKGNWNYPTQMIFGPGRIRNTAQPCSHLGMQRPLMANDPGPAG